MSATESVQDLHARVTSWINDDPDESCRGELSALLERIDDPAVAAELSDRFDGTLEFGTAGLRGPLRAGPNGMNRAVVMRAAAGIAAYLNGHGADGPVVIGYDARTGSHDFAIDTAQVIAGAGRVALLLPRHLPTPVLAYATRALEASAGIMVTASHNPPQDNGYKVYLGRPEGRDAQIVPPADSEISRHISDIARISDVPRSQDYSVLDDAVYEDYLNSAANVVLPGSPRELRVVSTALHGVGGDTLLSAFTRAGFSAPVPVAGQQRPNPEFPGLDFPNPEEAGVMDDVLALAVTEGADLAIANDPDADRCAAGAAMREGWRALRGDELGILLADHLIRRGERGTFATTIVSSSLLGELATARGVPFVETLTGFKWIVRGPDETGVPLRFGYEEAIGFCVDPRSVNDKDGISAALLTAELAATLKAEGSSLQERLDEIYREFGHYLTAQVSIRVQDLNIITDTMSRLRQAPPQSVGDVPVHTEDLLPRTDGLIWRGQNLRVVVRPSGTEPKLKAYLQVVQPYQDDAAATAQLAAQRMAALHAAVSDLVS